MKRRLLSDLHLYNSTELLYGLIDTNCRLVNTNHLLNQHFAGAEEEVTGKFLYEVIEGITLEKCLHIRKIIFQNPGIITIVEAAAPARHTPGRRFRWEVSAALEPGGGIAGIRFVGRDITTVRQQDSRPVLPDSISEAVVSMNSEFEIKSWNKAAECLYGLQKNEVLGRFFADVMLYSFVDDNIETFISNLHRYGQWQGSMMYIRKDRIIKFINASVSAVKDQEGSTIGYVAINSDEEQKNTSHTAGLKAIFDAEYGFVGLVNPDSSCSWQMILHWHR